MSDFEDRTVGELRVRIDRTLCVGFGDCITEATSFSQRTRNRSH